MRIVTVADRAGWGLEILKKSCERYGVELKILGMGEKYRGNGTKIVILTKFLKGLDPNEIVLFTDAYDSFFVRPISGLLEQFVSSGHQILFSCEDNYYYRLQGLRHFFENPYYKSKYPPSQSIYPKYRYLNSGGFMGYSKDLIELFEASRIARQMTSDQANLHKYLVNNPGKIGLDYNHEIFTNYGKHSDPDRFTISGGSLINNLTNSRPFIFHFPGRKHKGLELFAKEFDLIP